MGFGGFFDTIAKGFSDFFARMAYGATSFAWDNWDDFYLEWEAGNFGTALVQGRMLPSFIATVILAYAIYTVVEGDTGSYEAPEEKRLGEI